MNHMSQQAEARGFQFKGLGRDRFATGITNRLSAVAMGAITLSRRGPAMEGKLERTVIREAKCGRDSGEADSFGVGQKYSVDG